jgi:hypothetical protein
VDWRLEIDCQRSTMQPENPFANAIRNHDLV